MARTISDEELQLKRRARRRLLGAIVLVVGIVVVLPMVLDSEPQPVSQNIAIRIPDPDAGSFASRIGPLPSPQAAKPAGQAREASAAADAAPAAEKIPAAPAAAKAAPKRPAQPQKTVKPAKAAAKPAQGQFVVQVIALADAEKAKRMQESIAASGVKSYTEIVKTAKGDVTRVRAGPFATRAAAEKAREQLKALGMNGNVTAR